MFHGLLLYNKPLICSGFIFSLPLIALCGSHLGSLTQLQSGSTWSICLPVDFTHLSSMAAWACPRFWHAGSGLQRFVPWEREPGRSQMAFHLGSHIASLLPYSVSQWSPTDSPRFTRKGQRLYPLDRIKEQVGPETLLQPYLDNTVCHGETR